MKGKTSNKSQNCFTFVSGYSLSLKNTCTISFSTSGFGFSGNDNGGLGNPTNTIILSITSSFTVFSTLSTAFPYQACHAKSNIITLNPIFYNSGDSELNENFGPFLVQNTLQCDGFNFFY